MKVQVFLGLFLAALVTPVLAGDWVAVKLRGKVFELIGGEWQPLSRGDVVSDDRMIRTVGKGRVTFAKDDQTIDFGADTAGQIIDFAGDKTTVWHHFGTVAVVAEERTTDHFSVQTQFLAAVVKGTAFSVTTDDRGSLVEVARGQVAVTDTDRDRTVYVGAGEIAAVGPETPLVTLEPEVADELRDGGGVSSTPFIESDDPGDRGNDDESDGPATTPRTGQDGSDGGEDDDRPSPTSEASDDNKGHGNDSDGVDEDNPGNGGDNTPEVTATPDTDTDDGNNGHGNNDDGVDEDNPGNGGDDTPEVTATPDTDTDDGNNGHGNDNDGVDESNPGKSGEDHGKGGKDGKDDGKKE